MAVTQVSSLNATTQTAFNAAFILNWQQKLDWGLLIDWQKEKIGAQLRGKTVSMPVHEALTPDVTPLVETDDVTPVVPKDGLLSVTAYEYGKAIQDSALASIVAIDDLNQVLIKTIAQHKADTENLLVRTEAIGGTDVVYPYATELTRATLTTTNSKPTRAFLSNLYTRTVSRGCPTFDDGTLVCFAHPTALAEIRAITEITSLAEYQVPSLIWRGEGPISGKKFPGEVFTIEGIRFVRHEQGKLYLSGSLPPQVATAITTGHAVSAGDTTIYVDQTSGLDVGSWITVGTLEAATAEQVLITAQSAASGAGYLTIRGAGKVQGDWGFKYDHVIGTAVTEAANVAALPVMGPQSIKGYLVDGFDRDGKSGVSVPSGNIPGRFTNYFWWNIFGIAKVDKWITRGECVVSGNVFGDNKY